MFQDKGKIGVSEGRSLCTCWALLNGVRYSAGCGVGTGEVWVPDVGAVLVDGAARSGVEEQTANTEPE